MGAGNAADDSQNRKIVADNHDTFRFLVAPRDLSQTIPRPVSDIGEPLAAGDTYFRGYTAPAHEKLGVGGFDFVEGQSFELSMIELAHIVRNDYRQIKRVADELGGFARAPETAGIDRVNFFVAQQRSDLFGL